MLKNGADAESEAFGRRGDLDRSSVHRKRASVGLLQAGEDVNQCRLSRAILAEQDMDLTCEDVERDPIVCDDAGKPLRDATQFDYRAAAGGSRQRPIV